MPKKQTLTVAELKSLLFARFNMRESNHVEFEARLKQKLGIEVQNDGPQAIAIRNKIKDWLSDLLARRIKRNRRTTPMVSSRDFVQFLPLMIKEVAKTDDDELDTKEQKLFEKFMKAMFENLLGMLNAMIPPRQNPYDEFWRWATTVIDIAAERGILPVQFLALKNASDEIARRMFTKKQFVALHKRALSKFMDVDMLKKNFIQPMNDMIAKGNEEERRSLQQEVEEEIMPQLRELAKKSEVVINAWLDEEVERIYAVA